MDTSSNKGLEHALPYFSVFRIAPGLGSNDEWNAQEDRRQIDVTRIVHIDRLMYGRNLGKTRAHQVGCPRTQSVRNVWLLTQTRYVFFLEHSVLGSRPTLQIDGKSRAHLMQATQQETWLTAERTGSHVVGGHQHVIARSARFGRLL